MEAVDAAYRAAGGERRDGLLYGVVYWFVRGYSHDRHPDADNISKPIWDGLGRGGAYHDDRQVRLRVAGVVDLSPVTGAAGAEVEVLDLSAAPPAVSDAVEALASQEGVGAPERGFVHVELGRLEPAMLRFDLAAAVDTVRGGGAGASP